MKHSVIKTLAILFCLLLLAAPFQRARADGDIELPEIGGNDPCGDFLKWEYQVIEDENPDETVHRLKITGRGSMYNYTASTPAPWHNLAASIDEIWLPDGLTSIGNYAFADIDRVFGVVIPKEVTRIGTCAFRDCRIFEVSDPAVYYIGTEAMWNGVTVASDAFPSESYYCFMFDQKPGPNLDWTYDKGTLTVTGSGEMDDYDLPWEPIFDRITHVSLPNGLTSIGAQAFVFCENLKTIDFDGTESQWNALAYDAYGDLLIPEGVTVRCLRSETTDCTVEWNANDVQFKGKTAYVLYNGKAHTPRFTVKDEDGNTVGPDNYTFEYKENTQAGTGYVFVTLKNAYAGTCRGSFKIYLPATTKTTVENVDEGIKVTWEPVEGAAGYVIYRRAWNLVDNGWTTFARWNNTTATTYIDGVDAAHKVYAGTRYQYGVKAYFTRRLDPVSGTEIGGNVNADSGNFNLGMVGPLKTTVRITTRKLTSVTGGSNQLTVKWEGSKNFTGYEVQIATDAAFTKNIKTVRITNAATYQTTIKSLKARTTYYARVRSYHEFNGMTYYGGWSNVLNGKTK